MMSIYAIPPLYVSPVAHLRNAPAAPWWDAWVETHEWCRRRALDSYTWGPDTAKVGAREAHRPTTVYCRMTERAFYPVPDKPGEYLSAAGGALRWRCASPSQRTILHNCTLIPAVGVLRPGDKPEDPKAPSIYLPSALLDLVSPVDEVWSSSEVVQHVALRCSPEELARYALVVKLAGRAAARPLLRWPPGMAERR
jgi:hypothetical protein